MAFNIEIYETQSGFVPFESFINSLTNKMKAKVLRDLDLLQEVGNQLREPYSRSLGDGLFELRTKQGSDISRTVYFFFIGNTIVITHGFIKKTQKTPAKEIEKAKQYREDWMRRKADEIQ